MKMAAAKISKLPVVRKNIGKRGRPTDAARTLLFGRLALPTNPQEIMSPMLPAIEAIAATFESRYVSRRARAAALRQRMAVFSEIYNAAYLVRHSQHGTIRRREDYVRRFVVVLVEQMRNCRDFEALIFAVADSLTADPLGVPWEGS